MDGMPGAVGNFAVVMYTINNCSALRALRRHLVCNMHTSLELNISGRLT